MMDQSKTWKMVPVIPTDEMYHAAAKHNTVKEKWAAMLAVAPTLPPAQDRAAEARDANRYRKARRLPLVLDHSRIAPHRPDKFDQLVDGAFASEQP